MCPFFCVQYVNELCFANDALLSVEQCRNNWPGFLSELKFIYKTVIDMIRMAIYIDLYCYYVVASRPDKVC